MKTIQSLGWFFPDSTGGSEVYVAGLADALRALGVDSCIAAPRDGVQASTEVVGTHSVFRYPVPPGRSAAQQAGQAPHDDFDSFKLWLQQQDATLYHQHSLTYGCGTFHLEAARDAGMKTVLTIHTPGIICLRDTLMYNGSSVCDGKIETGRCASCWLRSRGMPPLSAAALAALPPTLGSRLRPAGRAGSALAATAIVEHHRADLYKVCKLADKVVVVCQWLHDAMRRNGVPADKLLLSRQGITPAPALVRPRQRAVGTPLVVGFLGRGDPVKGVAVLVNALRNVKADISLQLHVIESNQPHARAYLHSARAAAATDNRIAWLPPLTPQQVPDFLAGIDVLAVPSQWMETGPLVVLEAFAAGVPVIGSDLGGISELVVHRGNGLLVAHDDVAAWAEALDLLARDPALLSRLRANIGPVRRMADVAEDMRQLYARLAG